MKTVGSTSSPCAAAVMIFSDGIARRWLPHRVDQVDRRAEGTLLECVPDASTRVLTSDFEDCGFAGQF